MALVRIKVTGLAQLQRLLAGGVPQLLRIIGVESVRSAAEMVPLVDGIRKLIVPDAEGEAAIFTFLFGDSSNSEDGDAAAAGEVDDGDEADSDSDSDDAVAHAHDDDDDDHRRLEYWIVEGVPPLRRVADLAHIAIEMADEVLPALAATPGDLAILKRLRELGMEVRRAGLLVPGAAGARAVTLGNKAQKVVSRALNYRGGRHRSAVGRATWIADRRADLVDKVNAVLGAAVDFESA